MVDIATKISSSNSDGSVSFLEQVNAEGFCKCIELLCFEQLQVSDNVIEWLQENSAVDQKEVIFRGSVACLLLFVQHNYTGPPIEVEIVENTPLFSLIKKVQCAELDCDGEFFNRAVQFPGLLLVPYILLVKNYSLFSDFELLGWWALRTLRVYQSMLSGKSPTLENQAYYLVSLYLDPASVGLEANDAKSNVFEVASDSSAESSLGWSWKQELFHSEYYRCLYLLEISLLLCLYGRYSQAKSIVTQSMNCVGFAPKSTGKLGRRMKYQERSLAQLWIMHESCSSGGILPKVNSTNQDNDSTALLPPNIPLVDSDAIGSTVFDSEESDSLPLCDIEQVLLVASAYISLQGGPKHDSLLDETALAVIQRVITDPSCRNSTIRTVVLMLRNMIEEDKGRYQERVLKQWESISELYHRNQTPNASERLTYVFSLPVPPQVQLQKMFAMFLGKMGLVKNAMEIFEKLQLWEELIDCCCLIGHVSRAKSLIDERLGQDLDVMTRARLYCILGDLNRDERHYKEAWNISNKRFARAMRSLGKLYVKSHQWELAVESFLEALRVNALYPDIWFLLGYCAQRKGDLNFAANAFTRVIQQEPDNGEAWNNLASVYVELKKKKEAVFALSQAVKHKRESWKVWENLLMVSLSVKGESVHALNALESLVELRGRDGIYSEQLIILVEDIISELTQNKGNETLSMLCKRMLKLVGKITSMVSSDPNVWEASANLHHAAGYFEQEIADLQKQIRCLSGRSWWDDKKLLNKMLEATFRLSTLCIQSGDAVSCYSSKLHVNKIIEKCKQIDLPSECLQHLDKDLNALETKLQNMESSA